MVKVVGIDDKHIKKTSCKKCASLLEYTLLEVTYSSYADYSGDTSSYNYIICPKCLSKVEVSG